MDCRQVVEREPAVPYIRIANVVPRAELSPTPVDIANVPECLKGAAVIEFSGRTELVIRQAGCLCKDPVVRPRVEPD